jgi:hypothetical protein
MSRQAINQRCPDHFDRLAEPLGRTAGGFPGTSGSARSGRRKHHWGDMRSTWFDPSPEARMNGTFTGIFFLGFSLGSLVSGIAWTHGGWASLSLVGAIFGAIALSISLTGLRWRDRTSRQTMSSLPI